MTPDANYPDAVSGTGPADSEQPPILENDDMAELDKDSFLHWKEKAYAIADREQAGAGFASESLRLGFMEGKVGFRESIAMKNLPPANGA